MPRVPVLDSQGATRPMPTPYNQAKATPDQYGAQVGQAMQQVGAGLGQIAEEEKKKADAFRVDGAVLDYGKLVNDQSYGNTEKGIQGFLNQRSEGALDTKPTLDVLEQGRQKILSGLASDDQRRMFDLKSRGMFEQTREQLERHSHAQRDVVYQEKADGSVALALDTISKNYADPKAVESTIGKVLVDPDGSSGPLVRYAKDIARMPKEKVDAIVNDFRAKGYETALRGYLAHEDGAGAKTYFESQTSDGRTVKDVLGARAQAVEHDIQGVYKSQEGERTAMALFHNAVDPVTGRADETKAMGLLDKMPAGPVKDEARQRLEHRLGIQKQEQEQRVLSVYNRAFSALETSGSLSSVAPADKAWLLNPVNDAVDHWYRLQEIAKAKAEHARGEPPTPAQVESMARFLYDAHADPAKYVAMPYEKFRSDVLPSLSAKDWERASATLGEMRQQANAPVKLGPMATKMIMKSAGDALPAKFSDWTPEHQQLFSAAEDELSTWLAGEKQQGKTPSIQEIQKQATETWRQVQKKDPAWYNHERTTSTTLLEAKMSGAEYGVTDIKSISADDIADIKAQLTRVKKPITDANILALYNDAIGGTLKPPAQEPAGPPPVSTTPPAAPAAPETTESAVQQIETMRGAGY